MIKLYIISILICIGSAIPLSSNGNEFDDEEIDYILVGLNRMGTPSRKWPESVYGLKNEICNPFNKELFKVINYVLNKYESNINMQIIYRLYVNEMMRLLNSACNDDESKAHMLRLFKLQNNKAEEIKVERDKLLSALTAASEPENSVNLAHINCYIELYIKNLMSIMPSADSKTCLKNNLGAMTKAVGAFTKTLVKKEVHECDYTQVKQTQPKRASLEMAFMDALAVALTHKANSAEVIAGHSLPSADSIASNSAPVKQEPMSAPISVPSSVPTSSSTSAPTSTPPSALTSAPTTVLTKIIEEQWSIFNNPLAEVSTVPGFSIQSLRNPRRKNEILI